MGIDFKKNRKSTEILIWLISMLKNYHLVVFSFVLISDINLESACDKLSLAFFFAKNMINIMDLID